LKTEYSSIFILGNPRSGTTLLRLMLTNHSKVVIAPECSFMVWWKDKYQDWSETDNKNRLDEFMSDLIQSNKIEFWNINFVALKNEISLANPKSYSALIELIYLHYGKESGKDFNYWGDKNNYYVTCPEKILQLFPDAYFIHIIRDLRDVCCSYQQLSKAKNDTIKYAPNLTNEIDKISNEWITNNERVVDFLSKLNTKKHMSVRYEDLILDSRNELNKICSLLNLDFEENMLDFYKEKNKFFFEPNSYKNWKSRNFNPLDASKIGRYLKELEEADVQTINQLAETLLLKFNYL